MFHVDIINKSNAIIKVLQVRLKKISGKWYVLDIITLVKALIDLVKVAADTCREELNIFFTQQKL